jgi:uncharacterized membrane protein
LNTVDRRRRRIDHRDVAEIIIGSLVLAFPVAVTEEVWNLSAELSLVRTVFIVLASLLFISFFVHTKYRHDFSFSGQKEVAARVLAVYGLTLLVVGAVLFTVGKLPLGSEPLLAVKRMILVAFPASFAARTGSCRSTHCPRASPQFWLAPVCSHSRKTANRSFLRCR